MLLFVLTQSAPPIMILVLAVALYLVVMDLRQEEDLDFTAKAWWFLFVLLTARAGLPDLPRLDRGAKAPPPGRAACC